jgi:hypothetical protein
MQRFSTKDTFVEPRNVSKTSEQLDDDRRIDDDHHASRDSRMTATMSSFVAPPVRLRERRRTSAMEGRLAASSSRPRT